MKGCAGRLVLLVYLDDSCVSGKGPDVRHHSSAGINQLPWYPSPGAGQDLRSALPFGRWGVGEGRNPQMSFQSVGSNRLENLDPSCFTLAMLCWASARVSVGHPTTARSFCVRHVWRQRFGVGNGVCTSDIYIRDHLPGHHYTRGFA